MTSFDYVVIGCAWLLAALVSFLCTPLAMKVAHKIGAIDVPKDTRRMHKKPIPRLGGLAIFAGFFVSFCNTVRLMFGFVIKTNFFHNTINSSLAWNRNSFRLFQLSCLIHTDSSISIIAFIFATDIQHSICQRLIFPWCILGFQVIMECLPGNFKHLAIERNFALNPAVIRFDCNKH